MHRTPKLYAQLGKNQIVIPKDVHVLSNALWAPGTHIHQGR